ncbi:hypothetical protein NNO07_24625 [Pseudomonas resinovorans]|uniref:DUF1145 domain-containing protein n=1 Tax=Metapseudomonas resinovorans TaxID=53412 RepID=A0ABT4YBI8_METRE|nr:hypothetical protein [Pseudomonas resinovorans]MDA8486263.1 hypothetical protein [Pseudomonas resinovorans]
MNKFLKAGCLAIYSLALVGLFTALPFGAERPLCYAAVILLGAHALEALVMFGHVRRYPGSLAVSLLLALLFGFLHWGPLRQQRGGVGERQWRA